MKILNQIRTLSVVILGLAGAVTASGQVVLFDNMPNNDYDEDAGQCLTVDENQDCDPPERRKIANGFVPSESGTLARINLPIDYCTSYCGTCAGNGYEEEFSIDVSIQADDGGAPGEQSIHKLGAFSKTLSSGMAGVVDIDARGSGVQFVAGQRYWLVVEYTHNDSTANSVSANAANDTQVGITALATELNGGDTVTYRLDDASQSSPSRSPRERSGHSLPHLARRSRR